MCGTPRPFEYFRALHAGEACGLQAATRDYERELADFSLARECATNNSLPRVRADRSHRRRMCRRKRKPPVKKIRCRVRGRASGVGGMVCRP